MSDPYDDFVCRGAEVRQLREALTAERTAREAAERECLEQARLNGMGMERELALLARAEAAERRVAELEAGIGRLADDFSSDENGYVVSCGHELRALLRGEGEKADG